MKKRVPALALSLVFISTAALAFGDQHAAPRSVRTSLGTLPLQIAQPQAASSRALRDMTDLAERDGTLPANEEIVLFNRVLIRGSDALLAQLTAEGALVNAAPLSEAPGFWLVPAASIESAIALVDLLSADARGIEAYVDAQAPLALRAPTDPGLAQQWHLINTTAPLFDVNVEPAWNSGFIGAGVTIGIVEFGWQTTHEDLAANYNVAASQSSTQQTSHGTSVAGVAAAVANNSLGGAGVAYGAQISAQFIGSSSTNATALGYRTDLNHIKSNSWGPSDDNRARVLSAVERTAIETAIASGRGGLGTIFVWAAGNGGPQLDRVDYDQYASSRYTISIGSIGDQDTRSWHNETGSSMFFVAQTDGNVRGIYTSVIGGYTTAFGGSSSACPLAAGVVALMLQANPNLTWRDVQHILVNTARQCDSSNAGWAMNAAGRHISYDYGYGAIDAAAAVSLAQNWQRVGPEVVVDSGVVNVAASIPDNSPTGLTQTINLPQDIRIEAVELLVNATTTFVGDLQIELTAPSGTRSLLAKVRSDATDNYTDHLFTSRRHWDEHSAGAWSVNIFDGRAGELATWNSVRIRVYGTRRCGADFSLDGQVNESDLGILLQAWLTSAAGDADGDGDTDESDLGLLLTQWQASCP